MASSLSPASGKEKRRSWHIGASHDQSKTLRQSKSIENFGDLLANVKDEEEKKEEKKSLSQPSSREQGWLPTWKVDSSRQTNGEAAAGRTGFSLHRSMQMKPVPQSTPASSSGSKRLSPTRSSLNSSPTTTSSNINTTATSPSPSASSSSASPPLLDGKKSSTELSTNGVRSVSKKKTKGSKLSKKRNLPKNASVGGRSSRSPSPNKAIFSVRRSVVDASPPPPSFQSLNSGSSTQRRSSHSPTRTPSPQGTRSPSPLESPRRRGPYLIADSLSPNLSLQENDSARSLRSSGSSPSRDRGVSPRENRPASPSAYSREGGFDPNKLSSRSSPSIVRPNPTGLKRCDTSSPSSPGRHDKPSQSLHTLGIKKMNLGILLKKKRDRSISEKEKADSGAKESCDADLSLDRMAFSARDSYRDGSASEIAPATPYFQGSFSDTMHIGNARSAVSSPITKQKEGERSSVISSPLYSRPAPLNRTESQVSRWWTAGERLVRTMQR